MIAKVLWTVGGLALIALGLYFDRDGLLFLAGYSIAVGVHE